MEKTYPLLTRDPASGEELLVTRLESPASGVVIAGRFHLGWIGRLTPTQLEFVGLLVLHRGNVQKLAAALRVSYNTARARLDEIVTALGGRPDEEEPPSRKEVLDRVASGDLSVDEAIKQLREQL